MVRRKSPSPKTVLIIEDDPDVSAVLAAMVQDLGAETLIADDGISGVEAVKKQKPDLVLVDIHLPGMNGLDVIRTLRAIPGGGSLPLIVITGNSTVEYIRETAKLGADDFLVKANVLSGQGLQRIRKWLSPARKSRRKAPARNK